MRVTENAVMSGSLSIIDMIAAQWRTLVALMLRDVRTRFGGNAFGFFTMGVGWPLSHIFILILVNTGLGRAAPYGDSAALWSATGIVPYMAFQYISRFIMLGIVLNRPLLTFPIVKITDILFAGAIVEVLNSGLVIIIVFSVFWISGIDFMPQDIVQAGLALLAMMLLGLAYGIVNAIIAAAFPFWITGFFLSQIILWISSGIMFVPDALPEAIRTPLSYLPPLQGVEWMRSAYYQGYGAATLDKTYLISFSVVALLIGLALQRLIRGKLLQ